ncbi:MAG: redoxin domain-containing protein, partial [Gammaproteobacteria bacterium]|nr:redoxin domain-containing protein [Gammaproteobacteria bacterium]
ITINQYSTESAVHKKIVQLLLFLCIAILSSSLYAEVMIGAKVPNFKGQDLQGNPHKLSDYAGKIVVLEWSSPECPYSRRYYENGMLDSLYDYAAKNGITWINIVPKLQKLTPEQALERIDTSKKIVILDTSLDISTTYSATTTPQIFILDKQGTLSYSGAIDSTAMMKKTSRKVVPYTRNALDDLLAGREVSKMITRAFGCFIKNNAPNPDGLPQIIPNGSVVKNSRENDSREKDSL